MSHLRLRSDHWGGGLPLYGCKVCHQTGQFTESDLKQHLQQHTRHQLIGKFGRSVQNCDCRSPHGHHKTKCAVEKLPCKIDRVFRQFSNELPLSRGPIGCRIWSITSPNGLMRMQLLSPFSRYPCDIDPERGCSYLCIYRKGWAGEKGCDDSERDNRLKQNCSEGSSIGALFMVHCLSLSPWAMAMPETISPTQVMKPLNHVAIYRIISLHSHQ